MIVEVSLRSPISWSVKVANGAIPGAIHVDLDSLFFDLNSSLPHVMPPPDQFSRAVWDLGIRNVDFVVIYDRDGIIPVRAFAAHLASYNDINISDRSWCQRGGGKDLPVATT